MPALRRYASFVLLLSALLIATGLRAPDVQAAPLDAAAQAQVKPGMSKDEVGAALGMPARKRHIGRTGQDIWRYPTPAMETHFEITFSKEGRVTSAQTLWIPPF